ncbi:MAG TPA: DinB family protein, partial [Ktedonobacter sp.]|nr:DinB family protein [Ktedonobacter sp.]
DTTYTPYPRLGPINAVTRFVLGLSHDDSHIEQLREIMRQARAQRNTAHVTNS